MDKKTEQTMIFEPLGGRKVSADFDGGHLSSDAGALLLGQVDQRIGLSQSLSRGFVDLRIQPLVVHSVQELLSQRIMGIALGYPDLNDHNDIRHDPLLATAIGKEDPLAQQRESSSKGKALASPSTLNRLELTNEKDTAAHKIKAQPEQIQNILLPLGVDTLKKNTPEVVIDFDATDDLLHGMQEGRFYNGYYDGYCYLPLYAFIGSVPVWAQLRSSGADASDGTVEALQERVKAIRKRCPKAKIIVRADGGFCREVIMQWCEAQNPVVYYCIGLAKNSRLNQELDEAFFRAEITACLCGGNAREFHDFEYSTRKSWSRSRRVIGKAEISNNQRNPRFIVTNLPEDGFSKEEQGRFGARRCYEVFYCARGDMENRIKEQQLDLFSDRTSTHYMGSNQLRLWFSAFAHILMERLRTLGLKGTELSKATVGTIRTRLLKVVASVEVSRRRIHIQLASAFPLKAIFKKAQLLLSAKPAEN